MAALIDEARAVRQEAQWLRAQSAALNIEPLQGPWSTLDWVYDDRTLHSVRVPLA